jgi:hypothetical protein
LHGGNGDGADNPEPQHFCLLAGTLVTMVAGAGVATPLLP